jgi:hypothetical protein
VEIERDKASAIERLCARLAAGRTQPRAILGCSFPFDGSIFDELLKCVADALQIDHADLKRIPVDVICDRKMYREHTPSERYRVHLYPGPELFHPKLLLVLLEQEVIWISGSGNLTRAGYRSNREIALIHEPGDRTLPKSLRRLLAKLPSDAARTIRESTTDAEHASLQFGRFTTSLDGPIGPAFLSRCPRDVREVHLLAPFFEQAATADPIDDGWLGTLRNRFPKAKYRFYLPRLSNDGRKLSVQGDRALFEQFARDLGNDDQLRFFPILPDPGPLHGKLVAIVYRSGRVRRARILLGSPNPSRRALLPPRRNIEIAWIADISGSRLDSFLDHLNAGEGRRLSTLRFEPPNRTSEQVWSALSRVVFDPAKRALSLTWIDAHDRNDTSVYYGKRRLAIDSDNQIHVFQLDAEHGALTTLPKMPKRKGPRVVPGHCPIEVPLVDQMMIGTFDPAMTAEHWLSLLGSDPSNELARNGPLRSGGSQQRSPRNSELFAPSVQVRNLASRLRYALQRLRSPFWSDAERDFTLHILEGIYQSHEPSGPNLTMEQRIWRGWVRAELVQFVATAARDPEVRKQRLSSRLKEIEQDLRERLDLRLLPPIAQRQLLLVAGGDS